MVQRKSELQNYPRVKLEKSLFSEFAISADVHTPGQIFDSIFWNDEKIVKMGMHVKKGVKVASITCNRLLM